MALVLLLAWGADGARLAPPPPGTDCRFWSPSSPPPLATLEGMADPPVVFYWWDAAKARCLPCTICSQARATVTSCSLLSDTRCGDREQLKEDNSTSAPDTKEDGEDMQEGVLVFEAKDQVDKEAPAFGTKKHHRQEPPARAASTRDVHRQRMGEEFEAVGEAYHTEKHPAAFGNPKFYTDEDEDPRPNREKHLANVVEKFLKEKAENGTVEVKEEGAQEYKKEPSNEPTVPKNAFREIVQLMKDDKDEDEELEEEGTSFEIDFVHHKLLITLSSLTFFLAVTCLALLLVKGSGEEPRHHHAPARDHHHAPIAYKPFPSPGEV